MESIPTGPFFRWTGNKKKTIPIILNHFPQHIPSYYECFLGSGAILLGLLQEVERKVHFVGQWHASDTNPFIIGLWKAIQCFPSLFMSFVDDLIGKERAATNKKTFFYLVRHRLNQLTPSDFSSPMVAARFYFLCQRSYHGFLRVNRKGKLMPAFGNSNWKMMTHAECRRIHLLIQPVDFQCIDCFHALEQVKEKAMVYLDPPYFATFGAYTSRDFTLTRQAKLFAWVKAQTKRNYCHILLSYSDCPLIRGSFDCDLLFLIVNLKSGNRKEVLIRQNHQYS